jgi:hypothetical protein
LQRPQLWILTRLVLLILRPFPILYRVASLVCSLLLRGEICSCRRNRTVLAVSHLFSKYCECRGEKENLRIQFVCNPYTHQEQSPPE